MSDQHTREGWLRPLAAASVVFAMSLAGIGVWLAQAPVASAVLAEGAIAVEGESKVVQHLEGGIVSELLVTEGSAVNRGEPLVRLDTTAAESELAALMAERDALMARSVRLQAELFGDEPDFSPLTSEQPDALASAVAGQRALFEARAAERVAEQAMLGATLERLRARSEAVAAGLSGTREQIALATEELEVKRGLEARGVTSRASVRDVEQSLVALRGEEAALMSSLAEAKAAESEAELQRKEVDTRRISAVSDELSKVESRLAEIRPTLKAIGERIARGELLAPVAGTVVGLAIATVGGVVAPGEPIMTVVPDTPVLVAEAEVRPADRERLVEGMTTEIRLAGLETRGEASLGGIVARISADRLQLDRNTDSGEHYRLTVTISDVPQGVRLVPGMPVTVVVPTRARPPLDYLLSPLRDALARSMREV
jgi:HlyD family type I secretion membrane fusion protein